MAMENMDQGKSLMASDDASTTSEDELLRIVADRRAALGVKVESPERSRIVIPHPPQVVSPERMKEIEEAERERERLKKIGERQSRWSALVSERGDRYESCRLENFEITDGEQRSVIAKLQEYCRNIKENVAAGRGVLLFGPLGTGKDHLAMAVCHAAIRADISVRWFNGMDLFGDIRDSFGGGESEKSFVQRTLHPNLLYLSDPLPPTGDLSKYESTMLFRILDKRYSRSKPLIITVNVQNRAELEKRAMAQNVDRMRDRALVLCCEWSTNRKRWD